MSRSLTRVALPELPLPSRVKLRAIISYAQRDGFQLLAILIAQGGQGEIRGIEYLIGQSPQIHSSDAIYAVEDLLRTKETPIVDLLLGQMRHPAAGAFQTEHYRTFDVFLRTLQLVG